MASSLFSLSIDDIIIIDNQNWISMHCYVVIAWKCVNVLLTFEQFVKGGIAIISKLSIFLF